MLCKIFYVSTRNSSPLPGSSQAFLPLPHSQVTTASVGNTYLRNKGPHAGFLKGLLDVSHKAQT